MLVMDLECNHKQLREVKQQKMVWSERTAGRQVLVQSAQGTICSELVQAGLAAYFGECVGLALYPIAPASCRRVLQTRLGICF
jgi:hypothetical protein